MTTTSSFSLSTVRSEFTANSFTGGSQMLPDVLALSSGGFVVAYNNQNSNDGYVFLDFYDSDGNRINETARAPYDALATTSAAGAPSMTQLADGNVLVAWANHDPANLGIRAALFTPSGEKIGGEMTLVGGVRYDVHVEAHPLGGFEFSYADQSAVRSYYFVDGQPWSAEPRVDQAIGNAISHPTSAILANGALAVAWSSDPNGTGAQLHARLYNNDGTPVTGEMTLDATGNNLMPSIAALPNGYWAIAYADTAWPGEYGSTGISLKILLPHGSSVLPNNGTIHVNAPSALADSLPSVTALENNMILVTWNKEVGPNSYDIYGRVFTASGQPVEIGGSNAQFRISSASGNDTFPDVAALHSGRFVATWASNDNGGQDIAAVIKEIVRTTTGDGADDTVIGDVLSDLISSGGGNDTVNGGAGNDEIYTGAGNDTATGGSGNDFIDGGTGDDTAVFSHNFSQYTIHEYGDSIYVIGADGRDNVKDVEHLQFADATLHLSDDGNALFDTPYYLSQNHDVFYSGANALDHFNTFGWHEGRDPNPFFDTSGYLGVNKDVAASGQNPLEHYHQTGWHEGRDPSADFDTTLYLLNNPDVAAAGVDPLEHYLSQGIAEGRQAHEAIGQTIVNGFDAEYYLLHNPDVAAAGADPLQHYNSMGWHEGRNPNAYFDTAGYLSHYADVAASGINPLQHYEQFGWHEGRDPSAQFDTLGYLAANGDVAAAGISPLDHFLQNGIYEGRSPAGDGLWH